MLGSGSKHSSKSTTPNSSSTYQYEGHESWETFQHKVLALSNPNLSIRSIEHHRGGSYNRIVAAKVSLADEGEKVVEAVFRIPRHQDAEDPEEVAHAAGSIKRQAAVLSFLRRQKLPVPRVLAYDSGVGNAIGAAYIVQERLRGNSLDMVYDDFSLEQKKQVVTAVVGMITKIESVTFDTAGRLDVHGGGSIPDSMNYLTDGDEGIGKVEIMGFNPPLGAPSSERTATSLPEMFNKLLSLRLKWEEARNEGNANFVVGYFRRLIEISKKMESLGYLPESSPIVLHHWDLEPRNIIVELGQDQNVKVSGTIDWDDVRSVPSVLARKPPVWLWDFSDNDDDSAMLAQGYDGDVDLLPRDKYTTGNLDPDDQIIKTAFEDQIETALPGYCKDAFEPYGRFVRRLARFALEGFSSNEDIKRYKVFLEEWEAHLDNVIEGGFSSKVVD